jgi:serine/threonine protein kinase
MGEALGIAIQIADALDRAHQHGVVHRDLKPGNVMLLSGASRAGTPLVKLLDFGLAKLTAPPAPEGSALTMQADLTSPGMVLGTMSYMAPEQVEGRGADARTDIFAFGALLYELVTGNRAFTGETAAEVMTSVLKDDPADLPAQTPAGIRQIGAG